MIFISKLPEKLSGLGGYASDLKWLILRKTSNIQRTYNC